MAGPGIETGKRVATPVSLVDAHPTILDAVGAKPDPQDADLPGTSLFAVAHGAEPDRAVFSEYHAAASITANYMVRQGRYKLVWFVGMPPELFDLEADPEETQNLAGDPAHADALAHMEAVLRGICDPDEVDRKARADQAETIAKHGGREVILGRGDFGYSPAPGQNTDFAN